MSLVTKMLSSKVKPLHRKRLQRFCFSPCNLIARKMKNFLDKFLCCIVQCKPFDGKGLCGDIEQHSQHETGIKNVYLCTRATHLPSERLLSFNRLGRKSRCDCILRVRSWISKRRPPAQARFNQRRLDDARRRRGVGILPYVKIFIFLNSVLGVV